MSIRIVTHCWAEQLPQYATFLRFHLASLELYRSQVEVRVTVCTSPTDTATKDVISEYLRDSTIAEITTLELEPKLLGRRCIGRNQAALDCQESLVWFADVDMVFREGCLDHLWSLWGEMGQEVVMLYPRSIQIQKDHQTGDAAVAWVNQERIKFPDINPAEFVPKRYYKAIGGVQIVPGWCARKFGYLKRQSLRWSKTGVEQPFGDFQDDVLYRTDCYRRGQIVQIEIPELYRMRHTQTTYQ